MSIETTSVILGAVAALAAIASIAVPVWRARRQRPRVVLSLETRWKGPSSWTLANLDQAKPQIEHLTVTTAVPNDGHSIVVEDCGLWVAGRNQQLDVGYGASRWGRLEPGEKHEWYAKAEDVRRALGAHGLSGAVELRGIVWDAAGNRYPSKPITLIV
jgi:hypothetical protein